MAFVGTKSWSRYRRIINDFHHDAFQNELHWFKYLYSLDRFGEDTKSNSLYEERVVKCLVQYDTIRNWPINRETTTGDIDKESIVVYINLKYLQNRGWVRMEGNRGTIMDIDSVKDYFILDGVKYRPSGDKPVAQASDKPLLFRIVLKREELENQDKPPV